MSKLLASLPKNIDQKVLVGFDTSDDAGVYLLSDEQALVFTADFITPPVDDPYLFGQIAAANSLSDIYAMGGKPLSCLNLVGFPSDKLGNEILEGIVTGALQKITEAGAVLLGGHTTDNDEPIFGLAVTGLVHPEKIWRNTGAKPGDQLILTKALGSGVLFNANLKNLVSEKALGDCLDSLIELNKTAAEVLAKFEIHAATDITGFGFAGHALEMLPGSELTFNFSLDEIPILSEAGEMYERGVTT
ncbi:MAG TPA: selenide, water dikinase SelD, partial [Deltaproteobacteria bacterium]|nr:selenide, water dikinase SelD [Deltaproteobacteria bacterium]